MSANPNLRNDCKCLTPSLGDCEKTGRFLGNDKRQGEVWLSQCTSCARWWVFYRVEYEAFSKSGRWYRAVLQPEQVEIVTADTAVEMIAGADYRVFGGSYFQSSGQVELGPAPIFVDPFGPSTH